LQYVREYIDAVLLKKSSPEESFKKLDDMGNELIDRLRKLTKQVQEARQNNNDDIIKAVVGEYDDCIERYDMFSHCACYEASLVDGFQFRYLPILMAQAKIYWDMDNYVMVERIFRKSVEFCNENDIWKLNVAHVLFMQESKFKEAISFYDPIVKKNYENVSCDWAST
jgi:tetratricopeptide repeat protein 30